jgi:M6 family metalloprotease-like protein
VLTVFVRFQDDTNLDSGCRAGRGWPLTADDSVEPLPRYAHSLFATDPHPPFPDSSATEYFYRQSNGGLILFGDVFPRVVVSKHEAAFYRKGAGRGYGYLASEVFDTIDEEVDFARYDTNPKDGIVDHVFLMVRKDTAGTFTGVADLAGADRVRGRPEDNIVVDGLRIDWTSSGSFIYNERPGHIISQSYMVRMVAHELGHHIWNPRGVFGNHIPAIRGNDVPGNNDEAIGYVLMAGRGGGADARGDLLISAPERDAVGWLEPIILSPLTDTLQTIQLHDLYTSGEAVRVDVPPPDGRERVSFYLANRQRQGWFDQYRLDAPAGCHPYEMGLLRTTGLLIQLTMWRRGRMALDVLPADNTLELSIENATYDGDLFGRNSAVQITPLTTPSTALPNGSPTWFALDEIRESADNDGSIHFVFVPDFRRHTVVREDSHIGPRHGRVAIPGDLRVTNQSVLRIEEDGVLRVIGDLQIDPGSRVVAMPGSRLDANGTARFFFEQTEL